MTGSAPRTGDPVRVLLVDDEPLLRQSLRIVIDSQPDLHVVDEAASGAEGIAATRMHRPDIVLMDIRMPDGDGIHATRSITSDLVLHRTRVVVLTMFELDEYVYGALHAGASGFLLKDARPEQLLDAIRRVHAGEELFAPSVLTRLVEHYVAYGAPYSPPDRPGSDTRREVLDRLTRREIEVLTLIGHGRSNDEIAAQLHVSGNTVKTHVSNLLAKLHARDRAQLVIAAYMAGLAAVRTNR